MAIRDEVRVGNIYVHQSQRFGRFDNFFITNSEWEKQRETFFARAGLPVKAEDVPAYLTQRLDTAYNHFLAGLPFNSYASIGEDGWQLSTDTTEKLDKVHILVKTIGDSGRRRSRRPVDGDRSFRRWRSCSRVTTLESES